MNKFVSILKALYMSPLSLPLAWLAGRAMYQLCRYVWPKKRIITDLRIRERSYRP